MHTSKLVGVVSSAAILSLLGGCSAADSAAPSDGGASTFVAYPSDFDGFHGWAEANATSTDDAGDGLHGVGPLRAYWNHAPPHGSKTFPVGTIIVKETEGADVTQRAAFAMVKRGGDYNSGGASGWEWFSLLESTDGTVSILWRGVVAPAGETYANQAIGDCNGCHAGARANDSVWETALQLSSF